VGALLLSGDNYALVINVAALALIVCTVVIFMPARLLDSKRS